MQYKALLVGVSEYDRSDLRFLPQSENDVTEMRSALVNHCYIPDGAIASLSGRVTKQEFAAAQESFCETFSDVCVLYLSCHGNRNGAGLTVYFSDAADSLEFIISKFRKSASTLLVIIDACNAGASKLAEMTSGDLYTPYGNGCEMVLSCSADEGSFAFEGERGLSYFTELLCAAFRLAHIPGSSHLEFRRVENALRLLVNRHNEQLPSFAQHPIVMHDMSGTVRFKNPSVRETKLIADNPPVVEGFRNIEVEPVHADRKRYSVKAMQTHELDRASFERALSSLISQVRNMHVYSNERQKQVLHNKPTSILFIYIAETRLDLQNSNYKYQIVWSDQGEHEGVVAHGVWDPSLHCWVKEIDTRGMHAFLEQNSVDDFNAKRMVEQFFVEIDFHARFLSRRIDQFEWGMIQEQEFIESVNESVGEIKDLNGKCSNMGFADEPFEPAINSLIGMIGALENICLVFTSEEFLSREPGNRKVCLRIYWDEYNKDLLRLKRVVCLFDDAVEADAST